MILFVFEGAKREPENIPLEVMNSQIEAMLALFNDEIDNGRF